MGTPGYWDADDLLPSINNENSTQVEWIRFKEDLYALLASDCKGFTIQQLKSEWMKAYNRNMEDDIIRSGFKNISLIGLLTGSYLDDVVYFNVNVNPNEKGFLFFGKPNPKIRHLTEVIQECTENMLETKKRELFNSQEPGERKNNREKLLRGKEHIYKIIIELGGHRNYIPFESIKMEWKKMMGKDLDDQTLNTYFKTNSLLSVFQKLMREETVTKGSTVKLTMSFEDARKYWYEKMQAEVDKEKELDKIQKRHEARPKVEIIKKPPELSRLSSSILPLQKTFTNPSDNLKRPSSVISNYSQPPPTHVTQPTDNISISSQPITIKSKPLSVSAKNSESMQIKENLIAPLDEKNFPYKDDENVTAILKDSTNTNNQNQSKQFRMTSILKNTTRTFNQQTAANYKSSESFIEEDEELTNVNETQNQMLQRPETMPTHRNFETQKSNNENDTPRVVSQHQENTNLLHPIHQPYPTFNANSSLHYERNDCDMPVNSEIDSRYRNPNYYNHPPAQIDYWRRSPIQNDGNHPLSKATYNPPRLYENYYGNGVSPYYMDSDSNHMCASIRSERERGTFIRPHYADIPTQMAHLNYKNDSRMDAPVMCLNNINYDLSVYWQRLAYTIINILVVTSPPCRKLNSIIQIVKDLFENDFEAPQDWNQFITDYCKGVNYFIRNSQVFIVYRNAL